MTDAKLEQGIPSTSFADVLLRQFQPIASRFLPGREAEFVGLLKGLIDNPVKGLEVVGRPTFEKSADTFSTYGRRGKENFTLYVGHWTVIFGQRVNKLPSLEAEAVSRIRFDTRSLIGTSIADLRAHIKFLQGLREDIKLGRAASYAAVLDADIGGQIERLSTKVLVSAIQFQFQRVWEASAGIRAITDAGLSIQEVINGQVLVSSFGPGRQPKTLSRERVEDPEFTAQLDNFLRDLSQRRLAK